MTNFTYTAKNTKGEEVSGKLSCENPDRLKEKLADQGLILSGYQEKKISKINFSFLEKLNKVSHIDKIFFTQNLEVMIRTGFSVSVALGAIAEQAKSGKFKKIIFDLKDEIEKGVSLSKALRKYPKVFPRIFINMIEAGEVSGKLDQILKRLTIQMKKDHAIKGKVKGAMIYPIIITVAMFGIGIFSMIFVIPKITAIYEEVGVDLPLMTQILISTSKFMVNNTLIFFVGLTVIVVGFQKIISHPKGKRIFHKILLKTPIAGGIIKKVNLSRFNRILSSLLKTDIPIVQSFNIISETLSNVLYAEFVKNAANQLEKGVSLKKILKQDPNLFPAVVTQMISVGEDSGTLDTITEEVAIFYEEDVDQTMSNLTVIIEPVLMLVLGVGVGIMAAAIILPMYNLSSAI